MKIIAYLKSTMRVATAIFLSLLALAVVISVVVFSYNGVQKSRAKQYETIKSWSADLKTNLQFSLVAATKLVDGRLYLMVTTDAYPKYLDDPSLRIRNANGGIQLDFVDKDGFKIYSKPILLKEFSKLVDGTGVPIAMNFEGTDYMEIPAYASLRTLNVVWNLETEIPKAVALPTATASDVADHCAPNLSKAERLKRLAQHGVVRQNGEGSYSVGSHRLDFFTLNNTLLGCS